MQRPLNTYTNNTQSIIVPQDRDGYIRLDLNESNGFWDEEMLRDALPASSFALEAYPEYSELLAALTQYTQVKPDNLSITNGSDHAIELLIRLLFRSGDRIVLPEPTFFVYNHMLTQAKVDHISIPYAAEETRFVFPIEEVLGYLDDTVQGLLLCNPANPTGATIAEADLVRMLRRTQELGIPLVIDEAYFEYYGKTAAAYLDEFAHLIILRTLSKGFGLAGIRFGYVLAHSTIIQELQKLQLPWSVSHPASQIATYCLTHTAMFAEKRQALQERKSRFQHAITDLGIVTYESVGNFFLAKLPDPERFCDDLASQGILAGRSYSAGERLPLLSSTVRFGIPTEADMNTVLESIANTVTI